MVISPLLVPADPGHSTSIPGWFPFVLVPTNPGHGTNTSGWVCFSILYMSFMCYLLYDAVITRACLSRTEGSQWLVVVLLIVFSFLLCLVSRCVYQ